MKARISLSVTVAAGFALVSCANPFDYDDAAATDPSIPSLAEIRDQLVTQWEDAESVTVTGSVLAGEQDLDAFFEGIEADTRGELEISGAFDGTNSELSFSAGENEFRQIAVDGNEYFQGESFAEVLSAELEEELAETVTEETVQEVIGESWVQFNEDGQGGVFSAQELLSSWESDLPDEVNSSTGEAETRGGSEVWVYQLTGTEDELVVSATEQPELISISTAESEYTFQDWNNSTAPEEPENPITIDEIFNAIAEQQGWDVTPEA